MATPIRRIARRGGERRITVELDAIKKKKHPVTEEELANLILSHRDKGKLKHLKTFTAALESKKYELTDEAQTLWVVEKEAETAGEEYVGKVVSTPAGDVSALLHWRAANMAADGHELSETDVKILASLVLNNGSLDIVGKNSLEYLLCTFSISEDGKSLLSALIQRHYVPVLPPDREEGLQTAAKKRKAVSSVVVEEVVDVPRPVIAVEYYDAGANLYKTTHFDSNGKATEVEVRP